MNAYRISDDWKKDVPIPVYDEKSEFTELYYKAWELAHEHIKKVEGMPQTPYMDEGFCDTQIWIWDSCFMSLFCKYSQTSFPGKETLKNFYEVLYDKKVLPKIIPSENEPKWTGAIPGVPYGLEIHIADNPPLFAWAEYENALLNGNVDNIKRLLDKGYLQKHYHWLEGLTGSVRIEGVKNKTCFVNVKDGYKWEGGRSGMDNTPRGRIGAHAENERPNNPSMLWIDAICQQALSANMIAKLFSLTGDDNNAIIWDEEYLKKRDLVNSLYWDEVDGFYYDIDFLTKDFYKVRTPASYWALVANIASDEQAQRMLEYIRSPLHFGGDVPLVSLSKSDADYSEKGNYWRGALWLPTAYAVIRGLTEYGFFDISRELSVKIIDHMLKTYLEYTPHTIWEAYSPSGHAPATNETDTKRVRPDFCGWSALGPISLYIENVIGFYKIDAFNKVVYWSLPSEINGKIGVRNLRFGNVVADIICSENTVRVLSNEPFTLKINNIDKKVSAGANEILL